MLLREVEYARPESVDEAVRLLSSRDNARPLAGGQSLVNVMKVRVASPDVVVDLARIPELREIRVGSHGSLELGAMVTYAQLIASEEARSARPILGEVVETIADVQVRNRGTVGGNICSNDPTNHLPPLLAAVEATMTIRASDSERTVTAEEFFEGVFVTAVSAGELLTKVTIPARASGQGDAFASLAVGKDGTGIVNVAASVQDGNARIAVGCVSATPVVLTVAADEIAVRDAVRSAGLDPPSDVHASADYRRHLAEVLASRAVAQAIQAATGQMEPGRSLAGSVAVNGETYEHEVDARRLLVHILRDDLDLTGTHVGCDTGNCGACTVLLDGKAVKSCMLLAVQADGSQVTTVEGLAPDGELTLLQRSFSQHHALQCGYCTPGMLVSATSLLERNPAPSEDEVRRALQGNICRCTGYVNIVRAVKAVADGEVF